MHVLSHLLLLSGSLMVSITMAQQQQPISSRAQELGLKQTWYAPMEDTTDVVGFLTNNWGVNNNNFYGNADVSFESDPITNNASQNVMSVLYAAGSYSPSGKHAKDGSLGGAEFNAAPFGGASYDSALLSYDLAFAENFNWVLGGKLPGIYGGADDEGCSGGNQADGSNCFSMRLMWREGGAGEAYAYLPDNSICGKSNTVCNDEYGISFSRGVIRFKTKEWTKMEIYVKINNATESNGILQVWQDGSLVINQRSLKYRTTNAIAATSIMFSTFFGLDTFIYNSEFVSSSSRLKVSVPQADPSADDNRKGSSTKALLDQQHQIEAAIVRIMKTNKKLSHDELWHELIRQLGFTPEVADMKKRIESLIDRDYLGRDKDDANVYLYK